MVIKGISNMVESYGKNSNSESIRQRVFAFLDENPSLTAKTICEKLNCLIVNTAVI